MNTQTKAQLNISKYLKRLPILLFCSFVAVTLLGCAFTGFSKADQQKYEKMSIKKKAEHALAFMNKRDYKQAIALYRLIIKTKDVSPKDAAWAQYEIGFCYRVTSKYKLALANFDKVISDYPQEEAKSARLLAQTQIQKLKAKKYHGY